MSEPDYLICLECESPVYVFEWKEGRVIEALCSVCGNDDVAAFATEDEMEALALEYDDDEDTR
jgi:hypothetical protein